jgi:hypothetical protein
LRFCRWFDGLNRGDKPVATLSQCFNKAGVLGGVSQRLADLIDRDAETMVEIDRGVGPPKLQLQGFTRDDLTRMLEKGGQQLERLALQSHPDAGTAEFPAGQIGLKESKA